MGGKKGDGSFSGSSEGAHLVEVAPEAVCRPAAPVGTEDSPIMAELPTQKVSRKDTANPNQ